LQFEVMLDVMGGAVASQFSWFDAPDHYLAAVFLDREVQA
jgi:hypothetical protein